MNYSNLRFAICDDSKFDRDYLNELLYNYLDENNIYVEIDEFSSGEELLKSDLERYSLIFLDIYMNDSNGMEVAKELKLKKANVNIVFITISPEFAVESYQVQALHYMLKPVNKENLYMFMDKFLYEYYLEKPITIKIGRTEVDILLSDIIYVEASGKKSIIHTKKGIIESSTSFSKMIDILSRPEFIKPIRYAIVALNEIVNIPNNIITMSNGAEIPISRSERSNIKKVVCEHKWKNVRDRMVLR